MCRASAGLRGPLQAWGPKLQVSESVDSRSTDMPPALTYFSCIHVIPTSSPSQRYLRFYDEITTGLLQIKNIVPE